jgi:hypothetical protein
MVSTSAGMRCPECAYVAGYLQTIAVKNASSFPMSAFAGLLTGLAGAYATALLAFFYPFLTILVAPAYGRLVADAVVSFSENMEKRMAMAIGVGSILLGSLIAFELPFGNLRTSHGASPELTEFMIGVAITFSVAICCLRLKQRSS